MKIKITDLLLPLSLILGFSHATAQVDLNATDAADDPGQPVDIFIDITGDGSANAASWRLLYPTSEISNVDASQCSTSNPDTSGDTDVSCGATCGAFTPPSGFDCVSFILSPDDDFNPQPIASTQLGPITFTIDSNATPATSFDLAFADTDVVGSTDPGTITVQAPAGGFFTSDPAANATLDLGSAPVGSLATPVDTLTVENLSADAFGITGFNSAATELDLPAGSFTVAGNGSVDFDNAEAITCTPSAEDANTGTFEVSHDAAGGDDSPVTYNFTCTGLVPNVQVSDTTIDLQADVGGAADTADVAVYNSGGANANSASLDLTSVDDATEISVSDGLDDAVIGAGSTAGSPDDTLTFSCSSASTANVTETFEISYDDLGSGNSPSATITVNCDVVDTAPIYGSDPAVNETLSFSTDFGTTSATEGIDVFNANPNSNADDLTISSATADNDAFNVDRINTTFPANDGTADGTTDIEISCTPEGVGDVSGTLTVESNDGTQEYPLTCEGTGDLLTTNPAFGGTLNLGTVPPNSQAGPGTIEFTNNLLVGSIDVDCPITDSENVFTFSQDPVDLTISAQTTETVDVTGIPPSVETFQATLDCSFFVSKGGARGTELRQITVVVSGRPLVVPTMSSWGLVVMSLMLLLAGGFATRRMMA